MGCDALDGRVVRLDSLRDVSDAADAWRPDLCDGPVLVLPICTEGNVLGLMCLSRSAGQDLFDNHAVARLEVLTSCSATLLRRMRRQVAADDLIERLRRPHDPQIGSIEPEHSASPTVRRLLAMAAEVVGLDTLYISRLSDDHEHVMWVRVSGRSPLLPEGLTTAASHSLGRMTVDGAIPPSIADLRENPVTAAPSATSVRAGAYCGVPIVLPNGVIYGALCGIDPEPQPALTTSAL